MIFPLLDSPIGRCLSGTPLTALGNAQVLTAGKPLCLPHTFEFLFSAYRLHSPFLEPLQPGVSQATYHFCIEGCLWAYPPRLPRVFPHPPLVSLGLRFPFPRVWNSRFSNLVQLPSPPLALAFQHRCRNIPTHVRTPPTLSCPCPLGTVFFDPRVVFLLTWRRIRWSTP